MSDRDEWIEENFRLRQENGKLLLENKRLRAFTRFVLKWCDRGPPHGGPGNEAVALDAIRNHPVLRAMRAFYIIGPTMTGEEAAVFYRELLKKYIQHVGECEGTVFLSEMYFESQGDAFVTMYRGVHREATRFTKAELEELCLLDEESEKDASRPMKASPLGPQAPP